MDLRFVRENIHVILDPIVRLGWSWRQDGVLRPNCPTDMIQMDLPWVTNCLEYGCKLFENRILYDTVYGRKRIPLRCLSCWKVVMHPRTYLELRAVESLQQDSNMPCKCGAETRAHVPHDWGAYWYNSSKADGQRCKLNIMTWAAETWGDDAPEVNLKRGCTEFEHTAGPSEHWQSFPGQEEIEDYIASVVDLTMAQGFRQPEVQVNAIHQMWLRHAHDRGDLSYVVETGQPLFGELQHYD